MSTALLSVSSLRAGYGSGDVLQGVTFEIARGEIVAIIGRNGVGKSTVMKTIMGLLPASSGAILLGGESILQLRADQRAARGIGYVPQGREVFPELTVEENLIMGETVNAGKKKPTYERVYQYFPILWERRRQLAGTFSGGQQQMLAIGRALIGDPDLLLLDEPSLGIQPNIVEEIGDVVTGLNRDTELTILIVEQNLGLIEQTAQRGYAMDKGRIVASLARDELMRRDLLIEHLAV